MGRTADKERIRGIRRALPTLSLSAVVALLLGLAQSAQAEVEVTLKKSFIEKFKNRATITATFTVDKAHAKPNSPSKDGDLHLAGRAPEIGLPAVAEIMNAKFEEDAVDQIHAAESNGTAVELTGAWRLWTEHGGGEPQVQGAALEPFTTTNPDHVFQIHPVTKVGDLDLGSSLRPIQGYEAKNARTAFDRYENLACRLTPKTNTVKISTRMGGFNYVAFVMEANGAPLEAEDGFFVMAKVLDPAVQADEPSADATEDLLVRNRRMVFVKGTKPVEAVQGLQAGKRLHVLGIPRINLALVSWRVRNASERPEVLTWSLPYEIVIVGVYSD